MQEWEWRAGAGGSTSPFPCPFGSFPKQLHQQGDQGGSPGSVSPHSSSSVSGKKIGALTSGSGPERAVDRQRCPFATPPTSHLV